MKAVLCLPISRDWMFDRMIRLLKSLELPFDVDLLVYFDNKTLHDARSDEIMSLGKFTTVKIIGVGDEPFNENAPTELRRFRICNIWEDFSKHISSDVDFLFGLEDDTIPPANVFVSMLETLVNKQAAFVSAVEPGRHGYKVIGGWDITEKQISTIPYQPCGQRELDSTGLYCFVTWATYIHDYRFHSEGECLGPDVTFFRDITYKHGKRGIIDFDLKCEHHTRRGEKLLVDEDCIVLKWELIDNAWQLQQQIKVEI